MKMTQQDYQERAARIDDGTASDEDRRLVEHYEREGFARDGEAALDKIAAPEGAQKPAAAKKAPARKTAR